MEHDAPLHLHSSTFFDETTASDGKITGKHRKTNNLIPCAVRTAGLPTSKGASMWDQQTSVCSSSSTSGPQAQPCSGSWILTQGYQKNVVEKSPLFRLLCYF